MKWSTERFRCKRCGFDGHVVVFGARHGVRSAAAMLRYQRDTAPCVSCGKRPPGAIACALLPAAVHVVAAAALSVSSLAVLDTLLEGIPVLVLCGIGLLPFAAIWVEADAWMRPGRRRAWPDDLQRARRERERVREPA